jgi:hypothetical protein
MRFSKAAAAVLVAIGMLSVACVPLQPRPPAHSADSTVLFSVTLSSASRLDREPTGLIVDVEDQHGASLRPFAFTPNSRIPGHHTTFLVRLDLPAGSYSITRFSGIGPDGMPIPQYDVAPQMTFKMRPKEVDYLGHLELSSSELGTGLTREAAHLVIANAYEDELPNFVHLWPALRGRAIGHRKVAAVESIPVQASGQQASRVNETAPLERLDPTAAAGLPSRAQLAFRSFLHGSYPRAFAITASGTYTGMAIGGTDVIGRALQDCRRAQPAEHRTRCRLFALDETLLSQAR